MAVKGALDAALQTFLAGIDRVSLADLNGRYARLHEMLGLKPPGRPPRQSRSCGRSPGRKDDSAVNDLQRVRERSRPDRIASLLC